ncbi:dihydrodipicolinate reductase [Cyclonatronum proteinivorum]|uniref:4-hydroxy-tetrahydrodipicolinate reductase n=1 Tax=Cyclonatronum proteinivorum TaxID=1457365 RepID=A0A345UGP2_9BACT|nr:4-hydroxy-tetrahydrodipicolinate reductase [Cyclonatronum proteinivorum]AXI99643.1 dihydrodipicolinate reductase [Cyclonatronum proteinivorum]
MSAPLKLVLIGDGRMGRRLRELAPAHGFEVMLQLGEADNQQGEALTAERLAGADAAIDFTHPDAAVTHIRRTLALGIPLVVGTTGWLTESTRPEIEKLVAEKSGKLLYGSNFSLGVQLFMKLAAEAGRQLGQAAGFDTSVHEVHHTGKADAPSGTAITLARQFLTSAGKPASAYTYGVPERGQPDTETLRVSAQRLGGVFGDHSLRINSAWDDIELTHRARNRDGFAVGALKAAAWLCRQEQAGFYLIEDVVAQVLGHSEENHP